MYNRYTVVRLVIPPEGITALSNRPMFLLLFVYGDPLKHQLNLSQPPIQNPNPSVTSETPNHLTTGRSPCWPTRSSFAHKKPGRRPIAEELTIEVLAYCYPPDLLTAWHGRFPSMVYEKMGTAASMQTNRSIFFPHVGQHVTCTYSYLQQSVVNDGYMMLGNRCECGFDLRHRSFVVWAVNRTTWNCVTSL